MLINQDIYNLYIDFENAFGFIDQTSHYYGRSWLLT